MSKLEEYINELEIVKAEICDVVCKYPEQYTPEEWDEICFDLCGNCPLNKL